MSISSSSGPSSTAAIDDPLPSLQLLLRGGYIRSSSSGVFTLLPNALRILRKLTTIIDQELSSISASRLALPNLLPSKLWHQTGRYAVMGSELYKLRDRKDSEFVLGPTHEEEITKLVAHEVDSDRQLPLRLYQITTKFRDEPRPRMGLLRTKEFLMKDLYSFDKSASDAIATYDEVRRAYARIFDRVFGENGRWKAAEADTGAIGGNKSHEYHVEDAAGEDTLISCAKCDYTANTEKAVSMPKPAHMPVAASDVRVLLFGCKDVKVQDQVMHAFVLPFDRGLNETKLEKRIAKLNTATTPQQPEPYKAGKNDAAAQDKIELLYDSSSSSSLDQASTWDWKDRPEGPLMRFTSLSVLADFECASLDPSELNDALIAAVNSFTSRPGTSSNAQVPLMDLFPTQFGHFAASPSGVTPPLTLVDIRTAQADDTCPSCKSPHSLRETKAIEIGHTFYLGERYSRALEAGFIPSNEVKAETEAVERLPNGRVPFQMGCYGIGVSRILGALAQKAIGDFDSTFNDQSIATDGKGKLKGKKSGFVWPAEVAPFTGVIVIADPRDAGKVQAAQDVWHRIITHARRSDRSVRTVLESIVAASHTDTPPKPTLGMDEGWSTDQASELVIDDRTTTLGSKLADSDLTGYSFRIIVGKHFSAQSKVELQYVGPHGWEAVLLPLDAFGSPTS
ncbi:Aminoacyl-tRNA synthetase, class II (G/ H/ P/ S), conserved domain protein [Kalmanozyma brasiliensis GHG001]|uniref:proline--tRNA ligase n=1 Tax=Kalmanozyma brasiliensis (strain GHG001) TaxID=1365824 RepID=V5ENV1_KALBG|nr:Aminoacyl-tRNA synthetase, class II (G/ H/ P/ S), conserved domain protein [Kalmanozyma brasiliensis GHG001]EST06780.1 Aminoacyl-tRNA synthetase, class II (G/ H/ P/ S), conserved domain protein [Kalmanozyma brasiliensis GHG001]